MNNKNSEGVHCDKCGEKVRRFKDLKKVNEGFLCGKCIKENRAKHREFLRREVLGIRKRSDLLKEWAEKRKQRKEEQERLRKLYGGAKPQIKSSKEDKLKINTLGLYLTKDERLFLYKKLVQGENPLSSEEANKRIKNLTEQMKILIEDLRNKVKTPLEFRKRFDEGFARLIEEIENE